MTRDEAIKTVIEKSGRFLTSPDMAACLVDTWAAVGIIKLDEPKYPADTAREIMTAYLTKSAAHNLLGLLNDAGLKIVEK